jgi:hypothetical protein
MLGACAAAKFSPINKPFASGPSCTLSGVTSMPIIALPNIFGDSPISSAARTMPTVSGG